MSLTKSRSTNGTRPMTVNRLPTLEDSLLRKAFWLVSSGSAIADMVKGVKDLGLGKGDMVVILPDSIRSYLSKFADDDWLAANDLLPSPTTASSPYSWPRLTKRDPYCGATLRSLRLKPVITSILANSPCSEAVETMRDKGFEPLPVLAPTSGKLVGLSLSVISRAG